MSDQAVCSRQHVVRIRPGSAGRPAPD